MNWMKKGSITIVIFLIVNGFAFANPFGLGILQRAEVNQGVTLGGNLGMGGWPGSWVGLSVGAVGEYGFSGEDTKDSFSLNNLAAGFSISYDRTAILGTKFLGQEYVWRWNTFKFGPYAKHEILDPEKSVELLGGWAQFYLSAATGFKINMSSASLNWDNYGESKYLEQGPYSNVFMADLLILADYPLSSVVENGFLSDVTLTLGTGLANNRFVTSIVGWYDADLVQISFGYRPFLGAEIGVAIPLK